MSYTKYGTKATIVQYINWNRVLVKFQDDYGYEYFTSYGNFKKGSLTNPYDKTVYGVGFIGSGNFNSHHPAYPVWFNMIKRCYKEIRNYDEESYKDCTVDSEWHNFQNFAKWYEENIYACNERLVIDKDIKIHGNREYSNDKCMLVPEKLNLLFVKELARRGEYPIGVYFHKERNNYVAMCAVNCKTKYIGSYKSPEIAFAHYKEFKEKHIQTLLEKYVEILPKNVYESIKNYKIEITD